MNRLGGKAGRVTGAARSIGRQSGGAPDRAGSLNELAKRRDPRRVREVGLGLRERVARVIFTLALCAALGPHVGAAQLLRVLEEARPYRVECAPPEPCRADLATYIGWRVFQAQCATCHAADARGSSYAPDLTLRMSGMTQRDFFAALDRGYLGPQSTMPPRGRDPNVAPYYDELWSFLRARITGDLPPGPVARLP